MKNLPKSLHTVTVLVRLAGFAKGIVIFGDDADRRAVEWAMKTLGYPGYPISEDPYGLAAAALAQLKAGK